MKPSDNAACPCLEAPFTREIGRFSLKSLEVCQDVTYRSIAKTDREVSKAYRRASMFDRFVEKLDRAVSESDRFDDNADRSGSLFDRRVY